MLELKTLTQVSECHANPVKWKIKVLPCNCSVVLSFKLFLKPLVSKNICRYKAGIESGIVSKMSNDTQRYMPHLFGVLMKKLRAMAEAAW